MRVRIDQKLSGLKWGATAGMTSGILASLAMTATFVVYAVVFRSDGGELSVLTHPVVILIVGVVGGSIVGLAMGAILGGIAGALLRSGEVLHKAPWIGAALTAVSVGGVAGVVLRADNSGLVRESHRVWLLALLVLIAGIIGLFTGRLLAEEID